jgi:hypothetical protein
MIYNFCLYDAKGVLLYYYEWRRPEDTKYCGNHQQHKTLSRIMLPKPFLDQDGSQPPAKKEEEEEELSSRLVSLWRRTESTTAALVHTMPLHYMEAKDVQERCALIYGMVQSLQSITQKLSRTYAVSTFPCLDAIFCLSLFSPMSLFLL